MERGFLVPCYSPVPIAFERGEGAWLFDRSGKRYLDAVGGLAVCVLGHAHPRVTEAIRDQALRLVHTSNLYHIPLQAELGRRLCSLAGMERAFFCNSGAEANEAAIKIARRHAVERGVASPCIVVAEGAFHGRTLGALSATGSESMRCGFGPMLPGFVQVPYGEAEAIARLDRPDVAAVLLEPIQGEQGVRVPVPGYLREVRRLCDERGWLLLLDEVQTGMCRTGRWFAHRYEHVFPDVMTVAKGLANGIPIGACLARGAAATVLGPGSHGSTFGGNPLAARVALEVLDVLEEERLDERAAVLGQDLLEALRSGLDGVSGVCDVRGRGLMIGIALDWKCRELMQRALARGLLINVAAGHVVRLLPPLILSDEQARRLASDVCALIRDGRDA